MTNDDNLSLYAYVLLIAGVVLGASTFAQRPEIDVARLPVDAVALGAIETASIARAPGPEGSEAWNYPTIPWRTYEDGMRAIAREGKPGLLVFQASWCLVCRDYQEAFESPRITRHADDVIFILADIDADPDLQRRYDIDGDYIPRTFVLSPAGDLIRDPTAQSGPRRFFVDPYSPGPLAALLDRAVALTEPRDIAPLPSSAFAPPRPQVGPPRPQVGPEVYAPGLE